MFAKSRQQKINEIIHKTGAVTTADLVKEFKVSVETIRRDLLFMEKKGQITRVHGGAVIKADMKPYFGLKQRNQEFSEQKVTLSKNAAALIEDGDVIAIDAGSTAICFAQMLAEHFSNLTVVTHSLDVFNLLSVQDGFSVILCGGQYLRNENAFYGSLTLDVLKKIHVQKAFIFPSAVSIDFGICDYQYDLYQVQLQLLKCADKIYILADSSKFEKKALLKVDDMKSEYLYVTDDGLSDDLKKLYKENNIEIFKGDAKK